RTMAGRCSRMVDGDVDADGVFALLVDDGDQRDGGFARSAVADDQFALSAPDRNQRVNRLQAGLQRLFDRLSVHDAGGPRLDGGGLRRDDGAFAVQRVADRADDASQHGLSDRHFDAPAGAPDVGSLLDVLVRTEDDYSDVVLFKVQDKAANHCAVRVGDRIALRIQKLYQFRYHTVRQAEGAGDPITDLHDGPHADLCDLARIGFQ